MGSSSTLLTIDDAQARSTRRAVLRWWNKVRADRDAVTWRQSRDPWAVLVAETMLAQTQFDRVTEPFERFLAAFPSAKALASAPVGDAIRAWSGLGYNRRAVNLHRTATILIERYDGKLPSELEALLELPGVGPYTARAVLSSAFGHRVGIVDVNVHRVLARAAVGAELSMAEAQRIADRLVPERQSREWNVALMDFGSRICRARSPQCETCVLAQSDLCAWRSSARTPVSDPSRPAGADRRSQHFDGSDRQGRGRIIERARRGQVREGEIAVVAGWPDDAGRARAVVDRLVSEGLLVRVRGGYALP
jgi:A/G-specific adenine glycosylase